ncbi:MAG: hypothetical protein LAT64_04000 [Phycisphaerales bacterium]|nr:hypothetical protein [Planctomycetota bacterium]MCH8507915.1 hypothetical protein [Phycisphaerales bacterium]
MTRPAPRIRNLLAATLIAAAGLNTPAIAQDAQDAFGGVRFPIQAADGIIDLAGRSGWFWREGSTHRIVLDTDVRVVLGGDLFHANAASLWLQPLGDGEYQVFGVFRGVRADAGAIDIRAETLPVRGVVRASEPVRVRIDARFDGPPAGRDAAAGFHAQANRVFAARVLGETPPDTPAVVRDAVAPRPGEVFRPGETPAVVREAEAPAPEPVFRPTGIFSLSVGDRIVIEGGEGQPSTITATGGVVLQYHEPATGRALEMKAERAVLFLKEGPLDRTLTRLDAGQVEGIYLEGGVMGGDERWAVRAPRAYLDVERGRALMLDAVFWTTDARTGMPVYVRARAVRQESDRVFSAERARLANSPFFEPDFFIGIRDLEVRLEGDDRAEVPAEDQRVRVRARNVTLNALGVPVFWLPGFSGDPEDFPLRQVRIEDSNRSGLAVRTTWNLASLLNRDWPGADVSLLLDYYSDRGVALGLDADWNVNNHRGSLFAYLLPDDTGRDLLPRGTRIDRDGETRGMAKLQDLWAFRENWNLVTELSYISDEAFVPAFFPDMAKETEDFRNRLILERAGEQTHFALETSLAQGDFIAAEHIIQSQGYRVERLPEARFAWGMRDVFEETMPGVLAYGWEARAGSLRMKFSDATAASYGFNTPGLADTAFGTLPDESLGDVLRAAGLDEDSVTRLDTRHELVGTLSLGPLRVTPFMVGRLTAYDTNFSDFSPQEEDRTRLWGAAGVTLSTVLQKVDNNAESRLLDIHRLRHIVEPSVTLWTADTNITRDELPVFDDDVENLLAGTTVRAAVDQTWQTKRGGIGRWRDVDVLKIRTEYVWSSDRAGTSPIPRYFSSRPELSNPGEYIGLSGVWKPTEVLAIAGETIYDLEEDDFARSSGGFIIQHRPGFQTWFELRRINPLDATYGSIAANYRMTEKYAVNSRVTYNFDLDDFQLFSALIQRRFQVGTLGVSINYDNIRGETSFGIVFRPGTTGGGLTIDPTFGG